MAVTSRLPLRAISALSMSAARWSGRTSASDPFTLPMGVRQASTTNTELTLTSWTPLRLRYHDTQDGSGAGPLTCGPAPLLTLRDLRLFLHVSATAWHEEPRVHMPVGSGAGRRGRA